jgi:hypothetical protein
MVFIAIIIAVLISLSIFNSSPPQKWIVHQKIKYLSYIPPLDIHGVVEQLAPMSLEKIDFFKEQDLESDHLAQLERLNPIIDKVIYIPNGFHEYTSLDSNNRTGKIG